MSAPTSPAFTPRRRTQTCSQALSPRSTKNATGGTGPPTTAATTAMMAALRAQNCVHCRDLPVPQAGLEGDLVGVVAMGLEQSLAVLCPPDQREQHVRQERHQQDRRHEQEIRSQSHELEREPAEKRANEQRAGIADIQPARTFHTRKPASAPDSATERSAMFHAPTSAEAAASPPAAIAAMPMDTPLAPSMKLTALISTSSHRSIRRSRGSCGRCEHEHPARARGRRRARRQPSSEVR